MGEAKCAWDVWPRLRQWSVNLLCREDAAALCHEHNEAADIAELAEDLFRYLEHPCFDCENKEIHDYCDLCMFQVKMRRLRHKATYPECETRDGRS